MAALQGEPWCAEDDTISAIQIARLTSGSREQGDSAHQNDIGTTDAHVLVIHVIERSVTLTYTDVHIQRLLFFQSLFEHWAVRWEDTTRAPTATWRTVSPPVRRQETTANSEAGLTDYLAFLGSRLAFLIDWNRARKRLRLLLPKRETMALLKWAADQTSGTWRGYVPAASS
ncbi:MAG: hypothetical protein IPH26_03505 [Sterolibacteriaceae bacterium]|uniref:Uncharacterized protein n=1 Tax=Candidatus Methylophosphatis roskildensis TaxID=2899263 RepID=A0A9D7E1N1_9PROT|nr:hypothetical protein [Candidatus Methylophosphatis roskildensis]